MASTQMPVTPLPHTKLNAAFSSSDEILLVSSGLECSIPLTCILFSTAATHGKTFYRKVNSMLDDLHANLYNMVYRHF